MIGEPPGKLASVMSAGLLSGFILSAFFWSISYMVQRRFDLVYLLPFLILQCSIGAICSLTLHKVTYKSEFRKFMCNFSLFTLPSIVALLYQLDGFGVVFALPLLLLLNLAIYGAYLELRGFLLSILKNNKGGDFRSRKSIRWQFFV